MLPALFANNYHSNPKDTYNVENDLREPTGAVCGRAGGTGGDGLLQRFGLMVWPDIKSNWRDVDEWPNSEARKAAWDIDRTVLEKDQALVDKILPTVDANVRSAYP